MENKKIVAIIQARVGSTRLREKVLKKIKEKSVLYHVISRVKQSKYIDQIVIATTEMKEDDSIIEEVKNLEIEYFRGSENNVLSRYYNCALHYDADIIVRITSDCPLIDPYVIDDLIKFYIENDFSVVTNATAQISNRTYPRGLDTEVFSIEVLKDAFINANKTYQLEHVTPYIYENNKDIYCYKNDIDYSEYRWTLDTKEDLELISEIYEKLYYKEHDFYLEDIIKVMKEYPELIKINKDVKQKQIKN